MTPHSEASRSPTSHELIEAFRLPMMLLDRRRRIVHANAAASRLAAQAQIIASTHGRLSCPDPENHATLCATLDQLFERLEREPDGACARIVLPLSFRNGNRIPAFVSPIRRRSAGADGSHRVLLSIVLTVEAKPEPGVIERVFGLTHAEARLAARIAGGAVPSRCARELNVKISTVRSQLNAVYRKTGARSQAQLVALVLSLMIL